jgi:oligopeptide transport system permease protein
MIRFILRRLLAAVPMLFLIATATFFMMKAAPGGPFDRDRRTTPEIRKQLEAYYGFDKPLLAQYGDYLRHLLRGDLGPSFKYANWSVNELIAGAFPVSLELGCHALAVALLLGLGAGILASLRPNTATDHVPMALAMAGIALPTFVLGPLLILVFGLTLGWVNSSGWFFPSDRVLPALTLGGVYAAYIARLDARSAHAGLHPHRARQGRGRGARRASARAAVDAAAGGVVSRPSHRGAGERLVRGGDDLPGAGAGALLRHGRVQPRLHDGHGHGAVLRRADHRVEPGGGHRACVA